MKSKIKLFLTTCLLAVAFAIPITTVHADTDTQQILEEYYEEFKNEYASFDQTFEEFTSNYYNQPFNSAISEEDQLRDYLNTVNEHYIRKEAEQLSKDPPLWSFNIGNALENITFEKVPTYHKYDLMNIVQPGDIIFERKRAGITPVFLHHVMIVEGIYEETHSINGNQRPSHISELSKQLIIVLYLKQKLEALFTVSWMMNDSIILIQLF